MRLPWLHALLALAVATVWGSNFVVIKEALATFTPLWLGVMRFGLVLLPAVLFIPRPAVSWRSLAAYGVLIGAGQFGLLYWAMHGHISPGLASLVIQTQVFFTIVLTLVLDGERLRPVQWLALLLAASGLVVIALHQGAGSQSAVTLLGLLVVLTAAFSWSLGNVVNKRAGKVNMLAYVVWSSLFSLPPLLAMAWLTEGPTAFWQGVQAAKASTWMAVAWQAVGNTLFGYVAWGWLLARHPASVVTPWALLVPVVGMTGSAWWLGEPLAPWKLMAMVLVMSGLALNLLATWRGPGARS